MERNNLHSGHRLESNRLEGSSTGKDLVDHQLITSEQCFLAANKINQILGKNTDSKPKEVIIFLSVWHL